MHPQSSQKLCKHQSEPCVYNARCPDEALIMQQRNIIHCVSQLDKHRRKINISMQQVSFWEPNEVGTLILSVTYGAWMLEKESRGGARKNHHFWWGL